MYLVAHVIWDYEVLGSTPRFPTIIEVLVNGKPMDSKPMTVGSTPATSAKYEKATIHSSRFSNS